mgnify:FL=1
MNTGIVSQKGRLGLGLHKNHSVECISFILYRYSRRAQNLKFGVSQKEKLPNSMFLDGQKWLKTIGIEFFLRCKILFCKEL